MISKHNVAFIFFIALSSISKAQVKIGSNPDIIDPNSLIEMESTTKGLLPPRVTLTNNLSSPLPLTAPIPSGMLVYNSSAANQPIAYYYWNGSQWISLASNQIDQTFTGDVMITGRLMIPMGEINYFNNTGTDINPGGQAVISSPTSITNMVPVAVGTLSAGASEFDMPTAGQLRYTGNVTKMFHCAITISGSDVGTNDVFIFSFAKGSNLTGCSIFQKFSTASDAQSTALHCYVELAHNEYIDFRIGNISSTAHFTVKSINIFAMGM